MIRAVVEERDPRVAAILVELLSATHEIAASPATGWDDVRRLAALHPGAVLVLGPDATETELQHALELSRDYPGTSCVLVSDAVDAMTLQRAMRHGILEVVAAEDSESELVAAVLRAHDMAQTRLVKVESSEERNGKVVTFFGPKGGTGKTFVATSLGVLLAEQGVRTVLVDANVRFGDCAPFLRIRPERTLFDAAGIAGDLDESVLSSILSKHESGLELICAPPDPLDAEKLDGELIARTVRGLRKSFDVVLVDTGPSLDDFALSALSECDTAYLVTSLDLPAVKDAKLCLVMLDRLQLGMDKVSVILNRANSKVGFPAEEVGRALGQGIAARLSSDVAVPRAINNGVSITADSPKSKTAKELTSLATALRKELAGNGTAIRDSRRRSLLSRQARVAPTPSAGER